VDNEQIITYDLRTLLKMNDLDIRKTAADNSLLTTYDYFELLMNFAKNAPDAVKALSAVDARVSAMFGNTVALEKLRERIKTTADELKAKDDESSMTLLQDTLNELDEEEENRKLRILCVDDSAFMLQTLTTILSDLYEVFSLAKGALIEKFLANTTPELFILDYNMPEMTGFDIVPVIRSLKEHKNTPIIFLTAMGTPHHVKSAVSLGACDFAVKPLNAELLREKIEKHIVRKKSF